MQRYEKYKESGVDWIGEIPEHWKVVKLKYLGKAIIGLTYSPNDLCSEKEGTLVLRSSNLLNGRFVYGEKENSYVSSTIPEKLKIKKNDILICSRNGSRDLIGKCAIATENDEGYSFGAFTTVFRSDLNHYLFKILNSNIFKNLSGSFLTSTINQLTIGNLNSISVPIPSPSEQQTIATFLDDKTAKIDQTIAIKEKEIELLKERRQILIQKAVTKGLDDTVKLKDSGVDWIGEIPEHWEVRKITYLFSKIGSGTTPTSGDLRYYDGVINFLQTGDLNDGYIISTSKTLKEKALRDFTSLKIYPKESLVIAMYGATIGKLGILNIDSATNQACCVLSNPRNVLTKYFFFVLLAFRKEIVSMGYGGGQPNISQDLIKSLRFPIANLNEQIQIVSHLEKIEEKIAKAILLKQQEIERLKEYKTVLIDNVVTGKVRVS
ncbi:restriction endonuclease subunit S [Chryseobacterium sp. VD8]|uniref:restriction endonuclease subunit S n=1 Tax=Chryseobacterium sp. VD8 TaxID=3081254 RepID=UPI00301B0B5D